MPNQGWVEPRNCGPHHVPRILMGHAVASRADSSNDISKMASREEDNVAR